ncbi:lipoyl protein ligase domain-containing protein [Brevibacillus fluminis]|uniref:lipoyl protein ligase domain-containing protein n=1 Tax=Brevibacillus fluminis TaxID=511487 RepID=UPI003F89E3B9
MGNKPDYHILDTLSAPQTGDVLLPFCRDEAYARRLAAEPDMPSLLHLWRHRQAFVLGSRDAKLPQAAEAVRQLKRQGYQTAVRHSGGAAVPLDPGVVNLSLAMPVTALELNPEPHFEQMAALIKRALGATGEQVVAGEIAGAYCPGSYDLAMAGYKFCGIAQRRLAKAVVVQAFVIVEGEGRAHGERARSFYEQAANGADGGYPHVVPERMKSLSELGWHAGVAAFGEGVKRALASFGTIEEMAAIPEWMEADAVQTLPLLQERNVQG